MAPHLNLCAALVLSVGVPQGFAQTLSDPTRPPGSIHGGAPAASAPGYSPAQVVIISKDRNQATIDGQVVQLGGRYRNATVVGISEEEIVLRRPDATETIRLYSSIQRTKHRTSAQEPPDIPGRREEEKHEAK